jgi:RNA polymerase sigma-70 factor (ECF subfamily)
VVGVGRDKRPSDAELIAAMATGDPQALKALSGRYGASLSALAFHVLKNHADAEEVAADVLWQAWREAALYDPGRGSVAAWLVAMARSRAIDRLRALRARSFAPNMQAPGTQATPDPADEFDSAERRQIVKRAMEQLDAKERELLQLAYFSDLSQAEIAARLGLPLGTVKTRMRGALLKLRQMLSYLPE